MPLLRVRADFVKSEEPAIVLFQLNWSKNCQARSIIWSVPFRTLRSGIKPFLKNSKSSRNNKNIRHEKSGDSVQKMLGCWWVGFLSKPSNPDASFVLVAASSPDQRISRFVSTICAYRGRWSIFDTHRKEGVWRFRVSGSQPIVLQALSSRKRKCYR